MNRLLLTVILLALPGLPGCGRYPPSPLSQADVTAITIVLARESPMPIRSLRPERGGTAVAFLASGPLGGEVIKLVRRDGQWRVVERTECF